jgi:hypothetical protein
MGGSAFTDPNNPAASLLTPRMPANVYKYIRDCALRTLRTFYTQAECSLEAPAKADYGDVDILVASPCNEAKTTIASLAVALGATQYKENSPTTNFALRWPTAEELNGNLPSTSTNPEVGTHHDNAHSSSAESLRHIQLDLHICLTPERFEWELFHQAHGDLWNILGAMIRPYGVVVNHVGLHLCLAGVEDIAKDQRSIPLTTSPSAVLKFLDLDESSYWTPFESVDAMFAYAASSRFYDPKAYRGKEDLKSNDRLRMKKRPMFMRWYDCYLQEHKEDVPGRSAGADRDEVIEETKRMFGVEKEYEEKRAKGLRVMGEERLWSNIRKGLPVEGLRVGIVMRGVKREVIRKMLAHGVGVVGGEREEVVEALPAAEGDEQTGAERGITRRRLAEDVDELTPMQRAYVDGRFDEIVEWVKAEWECIERRQIAYEREQSTKHLLAKIERDKAKQMCMGTREPEPGTDAADKSSA